MRILLNAVMSALAACATVCAAGFDCAKATTPTEKAICADKELSDLDSKMTALYSAVRKALPADQQALLKEDQKVWLQGRTGAEKASLLKSYKERVAQLEVKQRAAAPGGFKPFGEFRVIHETQMYDQESDGFVVETTWDSYTFRRIDDKRVYYEISITGNNAHECSLADTATLVKPGEYLGRTNGESDGVCTMKFTVSADKLHVTPGYEKGCSDFCGARAGFKDVDLRAAQKSSD